MKEAAGGLLVLLHSTSFHHFTRKNYDTSFNTIRYNHMWGADGEIGKRSVGT